tara:strand:+ start:1066 stop:1932 length:867 start_codon:yes stop_codon:yes gene_type:complete
MIKSIAGFLKTVITPSDWIPHIKRNKGFYLLLFSFMFFRHFFYSYNMIPSSSMVPTLIPGDQVTVDKTEYNVMLPFFNVPIFNIKEPSVGDIVTFYKEFNGQDIYMVKRVVAVAGDEIRFEGNKIYVNGKNLGHKNIPNFNNGLEKMIVNHHYQNDDWYKQCLAEEERTGPYRKALWIEKCHKRYIGRYKFYDVKDYNGNEHVIAYSPLEEIENEKKISHLTMTSKPMTIPEGKIYVIGDNRNDSFDSRFWGFLDVDKVVGKVDRVMFNYEDLKHDIYGDQRYWKKIK